MFECLLAVLFVLVAWWICDELAAIVGESSAWTVFFLAILLAVWFTGYLPSLISLVLSIFIVDYFFVSPRYTLGPRTWPEALEMITMVLAGGGLIWFAYRERRANKRLRNNLEQLGEMQKQLQQLQEATAGRAAELEECVARRTLRLQQTTDELNAFVQTVAHDLRAPLRAQINLTRALLDDFGTELGEEGRVYAFRVVKAAERQMELVQDLMSHIHLCRAEMLLQPVMLKRSVQRVLEFLESDLVQSGAVVEENVSDVLVMANASALQLILQNLVSNAVKFARPGVPPRIRIWSEIRPGKHSRDRRLVIWVEDNGLGIPESKIQQVFGLFQRFHAKVPGTGLGLALVKKAAERMGGRVGVFSEVGSGSRFWVELAAAELQSFPDNTPQSVPPPERVLCIQQE